MNTEIIYALKFKCNNCGTEFTKEFPKGYDVEFKGAGFLWNKEYYEDERGNYVQCPNCLSTKIRKDIL